MYVTQPPGYSSDRSLSTTESSLENFALHPHFLVLRTKGPGTQSDKTVGTIAIVYSELVNKGVARFLCKSTLTRYLPARYKSLLRTVLHVSMLLVLKDPRKTIRNHERALVVT